MFGHAQSLLTKQQPRLSLWPIRTLGFAGGTTLFSAGEDCSLNLFFFNLARLGKTTGYNQYHNSAV